MYFLYNLRRLIENQGNDDGKIRIRHYCQRGFYEVKNTEKDLLELKILDHCAGFRVIIVIEANSYVNIKSSRLLPSLKLKK